MTESPTFELIRTLSELTGPTGDEAIVQSWITDRWAECCSEVRATRVNNILGKVGGTGRKLAIMGHADEICYLVKSISSDGFVYLWPYYQDTRGYPPRWHNPLNQSARIMTSTGLVDGIFATASGHVASHIDPSSKPDWNDWFVDLGVSTAQQVEDLGVHIGDHIIFNPPTRRLGPNGIVGKAMDDRAALAIATLAAEQLCQRRDLAYEVWVVSTVQEENGLIGASSVVDDLDLDLCLNLDVGLTGDIPGVDARNYPSKLGAGPVIVYMDGSAHYSRKLSEQLVAIAERYEIPYQRAIFQRYGSDAAALIKRGVDSALIAYPTRYTHSPIEMVDERDIEHCVDLIVAFATTPPPSTTP